VHRSPECSIGLGMRLAPLRPSVFAELLRDSVVTRYALGSTIYAYPTGKAI